MKLPRLLPDPASLLIAITLFFFGMGVSLAWGVILPILLEIGERSPRLAWLGIFLLFVAPIPFAAAGHRAAHRLLESLDAKRAELRHSVWAGLFAWMTMLFTTTTASLIVCVIDPPPIDPGALLSALRTPLSLGTHTIVWVAVAAFAAKIERAARND